MSMRARVRGTIRRAVLWSVSPDLVRRSPVGRPDVRLSAGSRERGSVVYEGNNFIGRQTGIVGPATIGRYTKMGAGCDLLGPLTIGRYCSLAAGFGAYAEDHPVDHLTTYTSSHLFDEELKAYNQVTPITIGHGVWAGRNVTVLRGVTVGNGAVLGAGSVVARDVEPYSIVTGVPAQHRRYRFDQDIIDRIEALSWWTMSEAELQVIKPLFVLDLNADPGRAKELLDEALSRRPTP